MKNFFQSTFEGLTVLDLNVLVNKCRLAKVAFDITADSTGKHTLVAYGTRALKIRL